MSKGQVVNFDPHQMKAIQDMNQRINVLLGEMESMNKNFHMANFQVAQDISKLGFFVNFCMEILKEVVSKDTLDEKFHIFKEKYAKEQEDVANKMKEDYDLIKRQTEETPKVTL